MMKTCSIDDEDDRPCVLGGGGSPWSCEHTGDAGFSRLSHPAADARKTAPATSARSSFMGTLVARRDARGLPHLRASRCKALRALPLRRNAPILSFRRRVLGHGHPVTASERRVSVDEDS